MMIDEPPKNLLIIYVDYFLSPIIAHCAIKKKTSADSSEC